MDQMQKQKEYNRTQGQKETTTTEALSQDAALLERMETGSITGSKFDNSRRGEFEF